MFARVLPFIFVNFLGLPAQAFEGYLPYNAEEAGPGILIVIGLLVCILLARRLRLDTDERN